MGISRGGLQGNDHRGWEPRQSVPWTWFLNPGRFCPHGSSVASPHAVWPSCFQCSLWGLSFRSVARRLRWNRHQRRLSGPREKTPVDRRRLWQSAPVLLPLLTVPGRVSFSDCPRQGVLPDTGQLVVGQKGIAGDSTRRKPGSGDISQLPSAEKPVPSVALAPPSLHFLGLTPLPSTTAPSTLTLLS